MRAGLLAALLCVAVGCDVHQTTLPDDRPIVFVAVPPLAYLAESVGGARVEVHSLMTPGQDPHSFEPGPRLSARLADARLYFAVGLPFEVASLPRLNAAHPGLEVVNVAAGIVPESADIHDPHLWTSPVQAGRIAGNMAEALCRVDKQNCKDYQSNYRALATQLKQLHQELDHALAPFRGESFFVLHPAWGHFAKTYGLRQVALEHQGKPPNARHIAAFIEAMRSAGAKALFVQPQSSNRGARTVAIAVGAELVTLDPLRRDLTTNLRYVANTLQRYLKAQ